MLICGEQFPLYCVTSSVTDHRMQKDLWYMQNRCQLPGAFPEAAEYTGVVSKSLGFGRLTLSPWFSQVFSELFTFVLGLFNLFGMHNSNKDFQAALLTTHQH